MKVFIAGPRAISKLEKSVEERLLNIYKKNITVIVGDANGVDKAIQQFYFHIGYSNVVVFASEGKARNNLGNWLIETVTVAKNIKGFDFYAQKDKAMAKNADYGFMIWNGESKGTLNNIINLVNENKKALVFFTPKNDFICIDSFNKLEMLLGFCSVETKLLYKKLNNNCLKEQVQLSLFL